MAKRGRGRRTTRKIKPTELGYFLERELEMYHEEVVERLNEAAEVAAKDLVKKTKATAPVGTGDFKRRITWTPMRGVFGNVRCVWHVKAPDHRLTHLIVHGHAKKNGGRTKANPFLKNALDEVLPQYEKAVEEAIKK